MRRLGWGALVAGFMLMGLVPTSQAGTFGNRTDITDVVNSMVADQLDSPLITNRAFLRLESSTLFASGSVAAPGSGTTTTRVMWLAFEPDQVKRRDNGGQLRQRDELGLVVILNNTTVFSGVVPGCRARVQAKGPRDATTIDSGNWSVDCGKTVNDTLQLTDQQLSALQGALGDKVVGKSGLKIRGKCTLDDCNIPPS
jgi:hypothetical protein